MTEVTETQIAAARYKSTMAWLRIIYQQRAIDGLRRVRDAIEEKNDER